MVAVKELDGAGKGRDRKRPSFNKLNLADAKWTHGRSCVKLPGRVVVSPTNFKSVSHLNLEDYSYNYYCRQHSEGLESVPRSVAQEYLQRRWEHLDLDEADRYQEVLDLEARHFSEATASMTYEYDLSVRKRLDSRWDPEAFRKYLAYYRRTSKRVDFKRSSLVYSMFTPLVGRHCTDSALVVEYFRTVCSHLIACENIFMGSTSYLRLFLEHSLRAGFDPWSLMRPFQKQKGSPLVHFCPVEWSLIQGKVEHLELLLQYGCPFNLSDYSAIVFNKKVDGRWWNRNRPSAIVMPTAGDDPPASDCAGYRRTGAYRAHFCVVLYLTASNAVLYGRDSHQRFAESIRLFMRSVPEPYVGADEILDVVGELAPSIYPLVSLSCDWYREAIPEAGLRKPRSLTHLCRCTIRKSCSVLPDGISELPLSRYLKSYLNMEW